MTKPRTCYLAREALIVRNTVIKLPRRLIAWLLIIAALLALAED